MLRLTSLSLAVTLTACLGRVRGVDDGTPPEVPIIATSLPACSGLPSAPPDRAPTDATLLAAGEELTSIAIDDTSVYFASANETKPRPLGVVPKTGGSVRSLTPVRAYQLEVDADTIYVGDSAGVWAYPKHGNGKGESLGGGFFSFAIDGDSIYGTSLATGAVSRRRKDGSERVDLANGHASQGVSVRDGYVYWANYADHSASRVRTTGGASELLGTFPDYTRDVVADCRYVYVSVGNYGDSVYRLPIGGGTPEFYANVGGNLTLDANALYVQNKTETSRVSLLTGEVTSLGVGHGGYGGLSRSIVVDDEHVYWLTERGVMRATK